MSRPLDELRGVGPGNEPHPRAPVDPASVRGYFVDLTAKTTAPAAHVPEELLPAAAAQLALGWWERSLDGDLAARGHFERVCTLLSGRGVPARDGVRWPYMLDVPKYGLHAPWFSAMAQGQAASVFVRAFLASGDVRWRALAVDAIRPLLVEAESELVAFLPTGPVLEEVPGRPWTHILNGWVYALWGLWDVHIGLGQADAGTRFRESTGALVAMLDRYDVGWWTRYSLYPHVLADLAKPFYHRLHITQMEVMARLTGREEFSSAALRWRDYDNRRHVALVAGQKLSFRATRSWRRR